MQKIKLDDLRDFGQYSIFWIKIWLLTQCDVSGIQKNILKLDFINFIWKVNVGGKVVSGQDNKILTSWQWQSGWFWWQSDSDPINSRSFSAHSNWFSISDFQSENGCHKLHLQWKIGPIKHSNICPTQMNCFLFLSELFLKWLLSG